jgi:hypothetical protein
MVIPADDRNYGERDPSIQLVRIIQNTHHSPYISETKLAYQKVQSIAYQNTHH